jgi:hypothetical protein
MALPANNFGTQMDRSSIKSNSNLSQFDHRHSLSLSKNGEKYNNNDLMHTMTKDEAYYNKKFMDPGKSGYHFKIGSKSKY